MKCLMLTWRLESGQFSHKIFCFIHLWLNLCIYTCIVYLQPFCVTLDFKLFIDSIQILFLLPMVIEVTASDIAPWFKLIQMRFKGAV